MVASTSVRSRGLVNQMPLYSELPWGRELSHFPQQALLPETALEEQGHVLWEVLACPTASPRWGFLAGSESPADPEGRRSCQSGLKEQQPREGPLGPGAAAGLEAPRGR